MLTEALARRPIAVSVGGQTYAIPSRPAADWLVAMDSHSLYAIVPGLLAPDEQATLITLMATGQLDAELVEAAAKGALRAAAARPWWAAYRLAMLAGQPDGVMLGEMLLAGVDPSRVTLGAWLTATYALAVRHLDTKARMRLDVALSTPPEGETPEGDDWDTTQW